MNKLLKENHIKYALIMCAVIVACLIIMSASGTGFDNKSPVLALGTFIAPFIIWYLGLKARKQQLKGKLTYKEGIAESFRISLAYGVISPFIFMIYYFINPAALTYVKTAYGMPTATDALIILMDMAIQFIASLIGGTVYGAILSLFLKSKKK
jgi:hypothetical protein